MFGRQYKAASRFCSQACWQPPADRATTHAVRAKRYGGSAEHVDRLTVFERDGWLCQLCHTPVDPELKWPAPLSASIDHVVPLSKGGDHLYTNVQLAHLRCNASKGARSDVRFCA
jgi:5-methylcytosine-specific restriction endonuclease McrA